MENWVDFSLAVLDFTRDNRVMFTRDSRPMLTSHDRPMFTTHRRLMFTIVAESLPRRKEREHENHGAHTYDLHQRYRIPIEARTE